MRGEVNKEKWVGGEVKFFENKLSGVLI